MKNKTNNLTSTLYYFSAMCFYVVSIIDFINKDNTMGAVYLCLGSAFLCLGSTNTNKDKNENKKK